MTLQDCLNILFDVKSASMATVDENGAPQVRIIDLMLCENDTLYFCTCLLYTSPSPRDTR